MKTSCALISILAIAAPGLQAQSIAPGQKPANPAVYDVVPGISQPVPDSVETIGMRQARANPALPRGTLMETYTGLSPAWVGIASALDTMAALGSPGKVLSPDTVVPLIRSASFGSKSAMLAYQMRVQASENSIDVLQAKSVVFSGDTQAEMRDAMRDVSARRTELDHCIAEAQAVTPGNRYQAQADLAGAYTRYAEAAARVEQLASS